MVKAWPCDFLICYLRRKVTRQVNHQIGGHVRQNLKAASTAKLIVLWREDEGRILKRPGRRALTFSSLWCSEIASEH